MTSINENPKRWFEEEISWIEKESADRKIATDIAHKEMFARGGAASYSLRGGSWIHPAGGERVQITEPMTDEEWASFQRSWSGREPKPDPKVAICLPFVNATDPYILAEGVGEITLRK